ncbi:MAG: hypothetical protein ACREQ9_20725, partial [Candidatus Binatia bacterium]
MDAPARGRSPHPFLLTAALCAFTFARALGESPPRSEWTSLAPGLWYRPWSLSRGAEGLAVTSHVFRADPRAVRVTMLDARRDGRSVARVSDLRQETGAYLVVN